MRLSFNQFNQVLRNIDSKRRGINIDKADLMSAICRACYIGKMPKNEMARVINFLIHEGYLEVLNNRVYVKFDSVAADELFNGFYVHWNNDYEFQTASIRAWLEKQKQKDIK